MTHPAVLPVLYSAFTRNVYGAGAQHVRSTLATRSERARNALRTKAVCVLWKDIVNEVFA